MKHTIKGYLVHRTSDWCDASNSVEFQAYAPFKGQSAVLIRPHQFDVDVPDSFDPRPYQIAAIQAEISKMRATAEAAINGKVAELQKLMAISNEVTP